jgi:hypothetical protein
MGLHWVDNVKGEELRLGIIESCLVMYNRGGGTGRRLKSDRERVGIDR